MRLSPSDLRALSVFRALGEHRGFLGAQLALGMSQSTISFHLRALEERLGIQLCRRGRRGFELTERGREIFEQSEDLIASLSKFENRLGELRNRIEGTLHIGVVDNTITDPALPVHEALRACHDAAPDAEIRLTIGSPETLVVEVSAGRLNLAIGPEIDFVSGLEQVPLYEESHALHCGRGHPLFAETEPIDVQRIQAFDFVIRPYAGRRELTHFPGARVSAHASNMEAQARFILSGAYLGYLPEHYARRWVEEKELRPLLSPATRIVSPFVLLTTGEQTPSPLHRLFVRALTQGRLEQNTAAGTKTRH